MSGHTQWFGRALRGGREVVEVLMGECEWFRERGLVNYILKIWVGVKYVVEIEWTCMSIREEVCDTYYTQLVDNLERLFF